jgi:hypothetical protein
MRYDSAGFFLLLCFWFWLLEIPKLRMCQLARLYSTGRNRAGLLGAGVGVTTWDGTVQSQCLKWAAAHRTAPQIGIGSEEQHLTLAIFR